MKTKEIKGGGGKGEMKGKEAIGKDGTGLNGVISSTSDSLSNTV